MAVIVALLALLGGLAGAVTVPVGDNSVSGVSSGACTLHPKLRERIHKDVAWLDEIGGITDAMIRNISLVCDVNIRHQCNVQATRMMIKDGEIYLNSLHPEWRLGPHEFIGFLLELYETSRMHKLPDLEFAWNGNDDAADPAFTWTDRATLQARFHGGPFPILAWSKSERSFASLVPYSGAFRCSEDSFDNMMYRLEELKRVPWQERKKVAFGRWNLFCATYTYGQEVLPSGQRSICPRSYLPSLNSQLPQHMDILPLGSINGGPARGTPVPLLHQNAYRYLVSTDGWAISSKFDKYLLLGSLIIKAASSRKGYYYDALVPDVHFLPCMNESLGDIVGRVKWALQHDAEAQRIAEAAQAFAVKHLHRGARLCYYRTLIEEMGKRMKYTPDCANRKLCIPLGRFLEFLAANPRYAHSCRLQEVLIRYGVERSMPQYNASSDAVINELLKDPKHWPRDTDIPPRTVEPYFPGSRRRRHRQRRRRQH
ncbi:hypothetical protein HYH02_008174 [Chlamydomonas schloesseri]|uniref:Glycosyl transferase CAP10 domain-containing protein n=1 Tax=Chlamydomonas schloesseri TaxID=2026947 RepID=A0A836B3Y9_9CHLO|nr:hypothetical protein HYH02_008174 [Chlamydomonas schloesseri]|eukprot:KAG2447021.1 hypothetical protein HYH02_008174 [Chlamydomonas schloesseri]